jgi:hypothetical protein
MFISISSHFYTVAALEQSTMIQGREEHGGMMPVNRRVLFNLPVRVDRESSISYPFYPCVYIDHLVH